MTESSPQNQMKRLAAEVAVTEVEDGMVVGLGTGSTATFALHALAARIAGGLRVVGIPTSEATARQAGELGIALTDFAEHEAIDLTLDGADEVEVGTLAAIKGLGGALLREKIVAAASRRMIVIVDQSKVVDRLGKHAPLPVEIVPFGARVTLRRLADAGAAPTLRLAAGSPFRTDEGNFIADCAVGEIGVADALAARLKMITGVIETGLFLGLATDAVVGGADGVRWLDRSRDSDALMGVQRP